MPAASRGVLHAIARTVELRKAMHLEASTGFLARLIAKTELPFGRTEFLRITGVGLEFVVTRPLGAGRGPDSAKPTAHG